MGRRRDKVHMGNRTGVDTGRNQAGDVGNVGHRVSAYGTRDSTYSFKVDDSRIGAGAADDQPRLGLFGQLFELFVIDLLGVLSHTVRLDVVQPSREIQRVSVGQVPAMG